MKTKYKHIYFKDILFYRDKRKTKTFACMNNDGVTYLGMVKWSCGWRQYCFFPASGTMFSKSCLEDINHFIQQLMDERKEYWTRCGWADAEQYRSRVLTGSIGLECPWDDWTDGKPEKTAMNRQYEYRKSIEWLMAQRTATTGKDSTK